MGLIKPRRCRRRPLRPYTTLRCVVARNQVGWCRGICRPIGGRGLCGRLAPHALRGRTQLAIAKYEKRKDEGGE
jgi:hypothetical protein